MQIKAGPGCNGVALVPILPTCTISPNVESFQLHLTRYRLISISRTLTRSGMLGVRGGETSWMAFAAEEAKRCLSSIMGYIYGIVLK